MSKINNPFELGDIVYHPIYGKVSIIRIANGGAVAVKNDHGEVCATMIDFLSFKPWPEPCHERPLGDGLYLIGSIYGLVSVARMKDGDWYPVDRNLCAVHSCYTVSPVLVIKKIDG